jgi:hypothetical protein
MARKEDIGKFIKKQFESIEKSPEDALWGKIDNTLRKRRNNKRAFLLLFLLVFIFGVNSFWFSDYFSLQKNTDINLDTNEINNENSPSVTGLEDDNSIKNTRSGFSEGNRDEQQKLTEKVTPGHLNDKDNLSQTNESIQTKKNASKIEKINFSSNQEGNMTHNQQDNINNTTTKIDSINDTTAEPDIAEAIPEQPVDSIPSEKNENKSITEDLNKPSKKWAVTVLGGLNTYNSFNNSSLIHHSLNGFKRSGTLDYTYGFALRFDLTDNLAISYGINKTTFSYFTKNIPASNESEINRILNYTNVSSGQTITSTELTNFLQNESQTDLLHQVEYIELPFLIHYSLSNKKLGIHTIGGISTYLHKKESLYVQNDNDDRLKIGTLNNLTGARFSLNLGVGLYYEISENLLIELNPTFKYSLMRYSNKSDGDKPYFIGVFTGLTYKMF